LIFFASVSTEDQTFKKLGHELGCEMIESKIFLVGENGESLSIMVETPFEREDILQIFLEKYPDLLAGDQISPENPRQWVLLEREKGIPHDNDSGDRWNIDHLFVDQDAVPTFVECKRSSDPRIRREVVAQMLEYAANGTAYWSVDKIRERVPEQSIISLLEHGDFETPNDFWDTFKSNLSNSIVRLVFVADKIPSELRRMVEFLNEKMNGVEAISIEIKLFQGNGAQKAVVPRVIGLSEAMRKHKNRQRGKTDESSFLSNCDDLSREFMTFLISEARKNDHIINWGVKGFSIRSPRYKKGKLTSFIYAYPPNRFEIYLEYLKSGDESKAMQIEEGLAQFNSLVKAGEHTYKPNSKTENIKKLKDVCEYMFNKVDELSEI